MSGDDHEDSDATLVLRPAPRPAPATEDLLGEKVVEPPPLRDAVLDGRFFGKYAEAAARFAALLAAPEFDLNAWFGREAALRLRADRVALAAAVDRDIVALDRLIGAQLDAILHHARLRALEGAWRGLAWLVSRMSLTGRVKLRILNVSWAEICRDLERAAEFDQSQLFRAVYEDEFGTPGGEPYGLLVVDHEIRHRPGPGAITDDVSAVASLAAVAAAAFAPTVISAAPALFGVDHFAELSGVADPASGFVAAEYQRWRGLASREDIRFLAAVLPRFLARPPYADRHRGFRYRETGPERVWSGAGYLVAACVIRAFETHAWPADMRGYDIDRDGGGILSGLPAPVFSTDPAAGLDRAALEISFTDAQERALVAAGMLPIGALPYGGQALLGAARSLQTAQKFLGQNGQAASANAKLSAQFNTMICVSRFAHYVKVMGRDMVGSQRTANQIQQQLQNWLHGFTNASTGASPETMAKYPLRDAQVTVTDSAGKPGTYNCIIQLQPHFQLDDIAATFRLMTELAAPGARK
jgi:type VI secretion system protein ImpD/type VI secretion system protein ImpC